MIHFIPVFLFSLFLFPSLAVSKDACYDCHGQKGMKGYVDQALFEQSVHSFLACSKCHIDVSSYPHRGAAKVNCGICHFLGREGAPNKQAQDYKLSVHGRASAAGNASVPTCQICHGSHYIYPSADKRSSTNKWKIPALCSGCHPGAFEDYNKSVHARALFVDHNAKAPTCFDCHLEHLIPRTGDDQWQLALVKQCGKCHTEQMSTYSKTFHGKVTQLGYASMAKCSDCHGSHGILPVSDQSSPLSEQNKLSTCRKCHPKATAGFTKFYAHAEESNRAKYPVIYYTFLFMTVLLISTFAFFFIHTFLWAYRSLKERMQKKGGE
jgi:nitrate/TMAO reductase-like tetraheme cytochrome c subunit